jgi:L-threonylcarbamoyladenylate synthase
VSDAESFERCMAVGGVAVFPADTVYGLACDPNNRLAVERLYALKRRPLDKPSAVMFFALEIALAALPELGERTRAAMARLLPSGVSLLLPNPAERFPLACGADPATLGLRVPDAPRLRRVRWPVLQSSANLAGGPDPRRLDEVPEPIRTAADLVIDGGELPGVPSTVVDVRRYEQDGAWSVIRPGMVGDEELRQAFGGQFHFDPATYEAEIRGEVPAYDRLQHALADASGSGARRILELGTGTGTTASILLARHRDATLVGIDSNARMLEAARARLPCERVELHVGAVEEELPEGPFDLVASALCVHHLEGPQKARLFERVHSVLTAGGRFVLADLVVPDAPVQAPTPSTPGFDKPSSVADQLRWLAAAGFEAETVWQEGDLAVIAASATPAGIVAPR